MATSSHPSMASMPARDQVIAHASLKVAQMGGMIVPPAYILSSLILRRGSGFSISRLMRVTTMGTATGAGVGAVAGWARLRNEPQAAIDDRVYRLARNPSQIQTDDYSVIGATLGALLVPTVFLKRAPLISLVVGGGCIGLGAGVWVHLLKMIQDGNSTKPEGMVGEVPVIGGNK